MGVRLPGRVVVLLGRGKGPVQVLDRVLVPPSTACARPSSRRAGVRVT
ncbi:hypothetical protein [Saccharothrix australiensis]|nr:hypothetical protein [Saccharothrix australiensis]